MTEHGHCDNTIPTQQQQQRPNSGKITPWAVAMAIPESIGSVDKIAKLLGVPRPELRKFINDNPELRDALDDELLAAKERVIEKTYEDCMNGSGPARQDFFKMVNGYFEKRDANKTGDAAPRIIIHVDPPKKTYKMLGEDGQVIDIDRDALAGVPRMKGVAIDADDDPADRDFDDERNANDDDDECDVDGDTDETEDNDSF